MFYLNIKFDNYWKLKAIFFKFLSKQDNEWVKFQNKKYEVELECAIQMSLALEEEKKRLKELEEEELRVSLLKFFNEKI